MHRSKNTSLLDYLVGAQHDRRGHLKTERLGGPAVHDHFEFCRELHRKIARLLAAQNAIHIGGGATPDVYRVAVTTVATAMLAAICKLRRYQPLCLKKPRKKSPNPRGRALSSSRTAGKTHPTIPPRPVRRSLASRGTGPVGKQQRSTDRTGRGPSVLRHARHRPSLHQSLAGAK